MITTSVTNTYKFVGLSTETKPKGPAVGSIFEETDTGDTFFYNGKRWVKLAEEESGGGTFYVTLTSDDSGDEPVWSVDKTFSEIREAYDNGMVIYVLLVGDDEVDIMSMTIITETWAGFHYININNSANMFVGSAEIYENEGETGVDVAVTEFDLSSLIVEP